MARKSPDFPTNFWLGFVIVFSVLTAAYYEFGPPDNSDTSIAWVFVSVLLIREALGRMRAKRDKEATAASTSEASGAAGVPLWKQPWNAWTAFHRRQLATCRASPFKLIDWTSTTLGMSLFVLLLGMLAAWASLKMFAEGINAAQFNSIVIRSGLCLAGLPFAYCAFLVIRTIYVLGEVGGDAKAVFRLLKLVAVFVLFYAFLYFFIATANPGAFEGIRGAKAPGLIEDAMRSVAPYFRPQGGFAAEGSDPPAPLIIDCLYFSVITIGTIGYGDIHPVTGIAKFAVCTEVVAGYFFLVIAISSALNRTGSRQAKPHE